MQDYVKAANGIPNIDINKKMISSVRCSRSRYEDALRKKRKVESDADLEKSAKKRAAEQLNVLKQKKSKN